MRDCGGCFLVAEIVDEAPLYVVDDLRMNALAQEHHRGTTGVSRLGAIVGNIFELEIFSARHIFLVVAARVVLFIIFLAKRRVTWRKFRNVPCSQGSHGV